MTKNRQISRTGIFLKKFRMERGEYQKGMAEKLRVSPPYLSAIESGKKQMSEEMTERFKQVYNLSREDGDKLDKAVETDKQIYRRPLKGATQLQNDLVTTVLVHALDLQDEYCKRLIDAVERFSNSRA